MKNQPTVLDEETLIDAARECRSLPLPREVIIEPTDRCNMRCRMCFYANDHFRPEDEMSFDEIAYCIAKLPASIKRCTLIGGEPLIHPHIVGIVGLLAERNISVGISTNGYLLKPEMSNSLAALGNVDKIGVSLDGPADVHNEVRGPNNAFQRTMENLKYASSHFPIHVVSVFHNGNERRIIELFPFLEEIDNLGFSVELAREYPCEVLEETAGRYGVTVDDLHMKVEGGMGPAVGITEIEKLLKEVRNKATCQGIPFHFIPPNTLDLLPSLMGKTNIEADSGKFCTRLLKARIDPRGNMIHCYGLRMPMGSLLEKNFEEIWNGDAYKAFRHGLVDDGLAPICGYCFAAQPSQRAMDALPSPPPVQFGIVGCGKIAGAYARLIRELPECELAGVSSRSAERGERFAADHETEAFSLQTLAEKADALILTSEPGAHIEALSEIDELGGKHVLMEKPLAAALEDCRLALELRDRNASFTWGISSQMRFSPLMATIRERVRDSLVGRPLSFSIQFSFGRLEGYYGEGGGWRKNMEGNVIFNQGIHVLDFLFDLFGLPEAINCKGSRKRHRDVPFDTVDMRLCYDTGLEGDLMVTVAGQPGGRLMRFQLTGEKAEVSIETDVAGRVVLAETRHKGRKVEAPDNRPLWKKAARSLIRHFGSEEKRRRLLYGDPSPAADLMPQIMAFLKAVRGKTVYPVTFGDAYGVILMAHAAQTSCEEEREVRLKELL